MRPPQAVIPPKMSAGLATRYLSALSPQTGHFHPPCTNVLLLHQLLHPPPLPLYPPYLTSATTFTHILQFPINFHPSPPPFSSTKYNPFSDTGPRKESASRSLSGRPSVRETQLLLLRKTQGLPEGESQGGKTVLLVTKLWLMIVQLLRKSCRLLRLHLPLALPLTTTIQIHHTVQ